MLILTAFIIFILSIVYGLVLCSEEEEKRRLKLQERLFNTIARGQRNE